MAIDLLMGLSVGRRSAIVASGNVVVGIILSQAHGRLWVARRGVANRWETSGRAVRGHRLRLCSTVMALAVGSTVLGVSGSLFLTRLAVSLFRLLACLPFFTDLFELYKDKFGQLPVIPSRSQTLVA